MRPTHTAVVGVRQEQGGRRVEEEVGSLGVAASYSQPLAPADVTAPQLHAAAASRHCCTQKKMNFSMTKFKYDTL